MAISDRLVTADELLRMPDDEHRYELVKGELRKMTPAGFRHGTVGMNLALPLAHHVKQHSLGVVCAAETGFIIASDPDTVLAPDVAFVRRDRLPASGLPTGFWPGAPDLAVEVLSPGDSPRDVEDKTRAWLEAGTALVLVVDPQARTITVRRGSEAARVLGESDVLDGGDVVAGFRLPVAVIFAI